MKVFSRPVMFAAATLFVAVAIVGPAIKNHLTQGRMTGILADARQLQIAIQMRAADTQTAGEFPNGVLPADLRVKSAQEYFARLRLVENNYLTAAEFSKLWGSGRLAIVNVARTDPPDTAFIVPRALAQPNKTRKPEAQRLSDRQPAILPAE